MVGAFRMALRFGVSQEAVEAIAQGATPALPDDERMVHAVARQLVDDGHVDQATYAAARQLLGDRGMVELVTLCGYYTLVSFTLNAFEVPLPAGEETIWSTASSLRRPAGHTKYSRHEDLDHARLRRRPGPLRPQGP